MTTKNRAVLYLRLSKEDLDKINHGDDSESIKNQRILLTNYAIEHEFQIVDVYSDDDYSGLYEDRPEFERMIEDAKLGKFDIIICKTQSRFSRNMVTVEKYINHMFPLMGIRFLSVVDNIDSDLKSTKKGSQISGLINEWYCEDLSDNIRSVFKQKMKNGEFLGSFAPYGYLKDPNNKHKFIIDDYAASIVRRIYDLYLQGCGYRTIASELEKDGILPPSEYKKANGLKYNSINKEYAVRGLWSLPTIKRILSDEVYIGVLQQGKSKKVSYKSKKLVRNKREDWIEIENHHEPIIDKETFYKVRKALSTKRKACENQSGKKVCHPLSGKIFCGKCGATMVKHNGNLRQLAIDKDSWYFACKNRRKTSGKACDCKSILYRDVKKEILYTIEELSKIELSDKNCKEIESIFHTNNHLEDISRLEKEIDNFHVKIEENINSIKMLYTDRVKGMIDDNMFIELKSSFETENKNIKEKMTNDYNKLKELQILSETKTDIKTVIAKYKNITDLTPEIVNELINRIEINSTEDGKRTIDIMWNL